MSEKKKTGKGDHQWSIDFLIEEFNKESDRAAVILVASLLDESLTSLLRSFFVPDASSSDELFDGVNAPIGTFSSKINIAYRLGLISNIFCRDLHLIRKIRNQFAHNVFGCSFENGSVMSRIDDLRKSAVGAVFEDRSNDIPEGHKGDFLSITSYMLFELNESREEKENLTERGKEFFYKKEKEKKEETSANKN